jgi:hypothetical protein
MSLLAMMVLLTMNIESDGGGLMVVILYDNTAG